MVESVVAQLLQFGGQDHLHERLIALEGTCSDSRHLLGDNGYRAKRLRICQERLQINRVERITLYSVVCIARSYQSTLRATYSA